LDESGNVSLPDFAILASWYRLFAGRCQLRVKMGKTLIPQVYVGGLLKSYQKAA